MSVAASFRYLAVGGIAGLGIPGVGGRLVMSAFSLLTGAPLAFSLGGSLAVVLSGALYGLPGGLLCWALDRRTRIPFWPRAMLSGTLLLLAVAVVAVPNNQGGAALERPMLSLALFLPLAISFAAVVQRAGGPGPAKRSAQPGEGSA